MNTNNFKEEIDIAQFFKDLAEIKVEKLEESELLKFFGIIQGAVHMLEHVVQHDFHLNPMLQGYRHYNQQYKEELKRRNILVQEFDTAKIPREDIRFLVDLYEIYTAAEDSPEFLEQALRESSTEMLQGCAKVLEIPEVDEAFRRKVGPFVNQELLRRQFPGSFKNVN